MADLFDIVVARKLSGGGGSGGNPNSVQTVVGTAANPWGDIDFATLRNALETNNASATLVIEQNQITGDAMTLMLNKNSDYISGEHAYVGSTQYMAFYCVWATIGVISLYVNSSNTGFVDGTAYASMLPTTLTVVWHPLPE